MLQPSELSCRGFDSYFESLASFLSPGPVTTCSNNRLQQRRISRLHLPTSATCLSRICVHLYCEKTLNVKCLDATPIDSTTRAKIYDFTFTRHRKKKTPRNNWMFVSSSENGYNDLIGYIYICEWKRVVDIQEREIRDRYYFYFVQTLCVCPNSYTSYNDIGHVHTDSLLRSYADLETARTEVASSVFRGPGGGDALCKASGVPTW